MSSPATRDITIVSGDDYAHTVTFEQPADTPLDVSARTYTAQVREYANAPSALATLSVDMTDADTGDVTLRLTEAQTEALGQAVESGVWDLQQVNAGVTTTILRGTATILRDATR